MKILLTIVLSAGAVLGQGKPVPSQGPPPKNLTQHTDGRFSANSDPANPNQFEVRVVRTGDTLSHISGEILKDPRLWPQLWEQNEHIINPHWIYPDDKILIQPVTRITEAVPPAPPEEQAGSTSEPSLAAAPPPAPEFLLRRQIQQPPAAPPAQNTFILTPPPPVSEVKTSDLYCSGFVRAADVPDDVKVIARHNNDGSVLATDSDYVYLGRGADDGVRSGAMYQVVRPTRGIDDLGRHYLEVAQIRVVLLQPAFAIARVVHNCEAIEVGDLTIPFQRLEVPPLPRPRPFMPFMAAPSSLRGEVAYTKDALSSFGSAFRMTGTAPGAGGGNLAVLRRGVAAEGMVVYIDLGSGDGVKPGDVFVVFREEELDDALYKLPGDVSRLRGHQVAIGELVVLKVEERASTALVTYATVGVSQGDDVVRR